MKIFHQGVYQGATYQGCGCRDISISKSHGTVIPWRRVHCMILNTLITGHGLNLELRNVGKKGAVGVS